MRDNNCIFCKIINKDLESYVIYEDKLVICFLDNDPINEGHILIVPKKHYCDVNEVDDESLERIISLYKILVGVIKDVFNPDGYTIMQNGGEFNEIGHYHMHIFPRYREDEFSLVCKEVERKHTFDHIKNIIENNLEKALYKNK